MEAVEQSCPTACSLGSAGFPRLTVIMRTAMVMLQSVELNEGLFAGIKKGAFTANVCRLDRAEHYGDRKGRLFLI